jgi:hypothetical protein
MSTASGVLALLVPIAGVEVVGAQDSEDKVDEDAVDEATGSEASAVELVTKVGLIARRLANSKLVAKMESTSGTALVRRKVTQVSWQRGQQYEI